MSSDVTAVLLTTGEATTDEAMASVARQTLPLADVIVVRDMRPFHRALNFGASRVRTTYFVQVDADMILDDGCVEALRAGIGESIAVAVGHLRDPLLGTIVGIKMYRTQPFLDIGFRDTIAPDSQFIKDLARAGWNTIYVGNATGPLGSRETFGEHRPHYSPAYTYRKHLMEGQRYRHRNAIGGFQDHIWRLEQSNHGMADIAQVAMARGFFRQHDSDQLGLNQGQEEFDRLESFLDALDRRGTMESPMPPRSPLKAAFAAWFKLGVTTFENGDSPAFQGYLRALDFDPNSTQTWPLKLALCQGLLQSEPSQDVIDHSFGILQPHLISRFEDAAANNGQALVDKILEYALAAGLSHVVIAAPLNVEFKRDDGSANGFRRTASVVAARSDSKGRPRIDLPFRLAGHIICPEPTRLDGLAWCIDALRAGYTVAHVPLAEHDRMRSLSRIVARHCHDRFVASRLAQSRLLRRLWSRRSAANSTRLDPALSSMVLKRSPTYEVADRRILMVAQDLGRGGSERQMVALVQGLVRRRFDVRILALDRIKPDKPGYAADIELLGVAVDYAEDMTNDAPTDRLAVSYPAIPAGLPIWLTDRVAPIQRAIIKHRPAVLHGRQDATGIATGMAGCLLGVPRTIVQQGSMAIVRRAHPASEPMRRAYQALATNPSIKILNNSKAGARDNEAWIGLPSDSIGLIYNGFVPGSARLPAETEVIDLRRSMGLADTDLVVGTVMRFVKEKDPDLWIDTAAAIVAGLPDVKFLIFGYGPFESAMRDKIKRLGLRDQVVMAGATTDVGLAFSAMDVVLLTSVIEGLPNVMIEAQAVGRSVVAPDVGGTREALVEGVTGRIASKRTAQQLAWAVIEILKDEPGRRRVLSAGPHLVAGRFDLDDMIETTLRYYGLAS